MLFRYLIILHIGTCEHYTIDLSQNTSKQHTCSYIAFKTNTLPCTLLMLLCMRSQYIILIHMRKEYYAEDFIAKYIK